MRQINKKSQIWISAVLYILIIVVALVLVLEAGVPILNKLRDRTIFVQTKDTFLNLNQFVEEVSSGGKGSQRVIPAEIKKGELQVGDNKLMWSMDTEATLIEQRSKIDLGNVKIAANADVDAYESNASLVLENKYLIANFKKIGNETAWGNVTANDIINYITLKDTNVNTSGIFSFEVAGNAATGVGYSKLLDEGYGIGSGSVIVHINDTTGFEYNLTFTLESDTDYLKPNLEIS